MRIALPRVRQYLQSFELEKLFIEELGWDRHGGTLEVKIDADSYPLRGIAQKRGVQIFQCPPSSTGEIPDYKTRLKIEKQVTKSAYEHLVIFVDRDKTLQIWQWVARQPGQSAAYREHAFYPEHQSGEALIQKLNAITIPLDEEEALDLTGTVHRLRDAFDRDRVTRQFYDHFRREHADFLAFIEGITEQGDKEWYASVMLNRLMFIYFIQKKGFLDGDTDYLTGRLRSVQARKGRGKFLSFYRYFLVHLFHEGFSKEPGQRVVDDELKDLLGVVPYLNGGLFEFHRLEERNPKIDIPDEAFEKLFAFFDQYEWHLDTRPLRNDREIDPEVLGYIFEKYINQKEMGAYYTKEDITDYIAKNTVLPYLFRTTEERCAVAFHPDGEIWQLIRENPDRYIPAELRKGVVDEHGEVIPLPKEVSAGIEDVDSRRGWDDVASAKYGLRTETWREYWSRRQRCLELRERAGTGEIQQIDDLVKENLDIRQFAQDVIESCEGSELLRSFYYAIAGRAAQSAEGATPGISVLDPTCGSGAFLFAALNILQPLYEACLERMEAFVRESDSASPKTPEEEIDELIGGGESRELEFKSTARWDIREERANKELEKVIVKSVAAMLNTEGGDLLIGVDDEGNGFGIEHDLKVLGRRVSGRDGYENWLTTLLLGHVGRHCSPQIRITFAKRHGKDVCRVSILPSPTAVYIKNGSEECFYIRAGNSSRLLTAREVVDYHKQRFEGHRRARVTAEMAASTAGASRVMRHQEYRRILEDVAQHPNRSYFILKSIVVNNLYGVDIMEEAVEICKLRLFLKLAAQVDSVDSLEPLPDVDFNIRAGNTLVGFSTQDEIKRSIRLDFDNDVAHIENQARQADQGFREFRALQMQDGVTASELGAAKSVVREQLDQLESELDRYLAKDYGAGTDDSTKLAKWKESHAPFHWFVGFHGVMANGGFDVIIGNPPYVEYHKVRKTYEVRGYQTERCGNLYAYMLERCFDISHSGSRIGMIVQLSSICTDRMGSLQQELLRRGKRNWISCYDDRPGKLFDGLEHIRAAIILSSRGTDSEGGGSVFTTRLMRWYTEARSSLFPCLEYRQVDELVVPGSIPKVGSEDVFDILNKVRAQGTTLGELHNPRSGNVIHYYRSPLYWIRSMDFLPFFRSKSSRRSVHHFKDYGLLDRTDGPLIGCILNSSLFYLWFICIGNGRNVALRDITTFPIPRSLLSGEVKTASAEIFSRLMDDYKKNSVRRKRRDGVEFQEYYPGKSKPIMDEIDLFLAGHYGFTPKEADFVINYDVKYRVGTGA